MSEETTQAVAAFTQAASARIEKSEKTLEQLQAKHTELQADMRALEQEVARPGRYEVGYDGGAESLGDQVIEAAQIESLRTGELKAARVAVKSLLPAGTRAAITNADAFATPQRDAEVHGPIGRALSVRDLLIALPAHGPAVEFLKYTRAGDAAIQAMEGDAKAATAMNFELVQSPVKTIATWIPASRQALDDNAMLADVIDSELRAALRLAEDAQLLKGDGAGANIKGLWTQATAYTRGQTGDKPSDTVRRAITQVQTSRGTPSGIVIHPVALESLEIERDDQGRHLAVIDVVAGGVATLWRVPVVSTDALAEGEFLIGDFARAARLWDRQQATVEISTSHADFFTKNLVAILAEERLALTVMRPELLVKGAFAG